jgi:hypothetical protein
MLYLKNNLTKGSNESKSFKFLKQIENLIIIRISPKFRVITTIFLFLQSILSLYSFIKYYARIIAHVENM